MWPPIRIRIGSRYQAPARELPSIGPHYDTYQSIDTFTVLGFENISPEADEALIQFEVTERYENVYVYEAPGEDPIRFSLPEETETIVRHHFAVGGPDTRRYENGQLVEALVAIEETQNHRLLTCPARELLEEQGYLLPG